MATPEEPGEVDNRLSLVPSDFPAIKDWEDGMEYDIEELGEGVKLRQISPGEFEVMPAAQAEPAGENEGAEPTAPAPRKPGYSNKAVEDLASEG